MTPQAAAAARKPRRTSSGRQVPMVLIGLGVAARLARDTRTYENAIMVVIVAAAMAGLGRAGRTNSFARLAAWDKRRNASVRRALAATAKPKDRRAQRLGNGGAAG